MNLNNNSIFKGNKDYWQYNACVGKNGGPYNDDTLARGYFLASQKLSEDVIKNRLSIDILIYPIIFNFRHAIELSLKYLISNLVTLRLIKTKPGASHTLIDKWQIIRKCVIKSNIFSINKVDLKEIDGIINSFEKIDSKGECFRYSMNKNERVRYLKDESIINIKMINQKVVRTNSFFDYCFYEISLIKDKS